MSTAPADNDPALGSEFEHEPVPVTHRKSLLTVSAVWFGFPMILTNAVPGGLVVAALGFKAGFSAIILANLIMFVYVGLLSYRAGETGKNFALQTAETFGTKGYVVASGFLSTIVVGWFAFNTGATGSALHNSFGWSEPLTALVVGIIFIAATFLGIRALSVTGALAAPLFIIAVVIAIVLVARNSGFDSVVGYSGVAAGTMTFGVAITAIMATFLDSGAMAADFTRWAKNGKQGVLATSTAFPIASLVAQLSGGFLVAAGAIANPATEGGDFTPILTGPGNIILDIFVVLFVVVNLGSVSTHCLYNGALSWSHIVKSKMRTLTIILGIIGLILAVAGVWDLYVNWLALLGVIVPPLGSILIADQIILRKRLPGRPERSFRGTAFASWIIGAAAGLAVHEWATAWSDAVTGMVIGFVAYLVIETNRRPSTVTPEP